MYKENIIACLGSRAILFVDANSKGFWAVPLGTLFEKQVLIRPFIELCRDDGQQEKLYPIGYGWQRDPETLRKISQSRTEHKISGIYTHTEFIKHGLICNLNIWHSFYPGDVNSSTIPAFHCDVEVIKKTNSNWVKPSSMDIECGFEVLAERADETRIENSKLDISLTTKVDREHCILSGWTHRARNLEDKDFKNQVFIAANEHFQITSEGCLASSRNFNLAEGESFQCSCTVGMYSLSKVMKWNDSVLPFKYQNKYSSANQVVNEARTRKAEHRKRSDFFDSCFESASIAKDVLELISVSWHSYLMNTWWLLDGSEDKYLVWEGCCGFLSTVDVEYNISPLYLQLWPELLKMQLIQWLDFIEDGVLCHDVGMMLTGGKMEYPHPMPVEENSNFLLMLLAYWKYTADDETLLKCFGPACLLSEYISKADIDGDGFVEHGTANTIDDGDVSVQYAPKQIYLAVKAGCAQQAFAEIADYIDNNIQTLGNEQRETAKKAQKFSSTAYEAVSKTFNGSYLPVCAPNAEQIKFKKMVNFAESDETFSDRIEGSAGCSIYSANGTVLLYISALEPGLDKEILKKDLLYARSKTNTKYGHSHSSFDKARIWLSQNMWSDLFSAYIALDPRANMSKYALMQNDINCTDFAGQFTDTWSFAELIYYPRGITSIGLFAVLAGAGLDKPAGKLKLNPPAAPIDTPLLFLADWKNCQCPRLLTRIEKGELIIEIEGLNDKQLALISDSRISII